MSATDRRPQTTVPSPGRIDAEFSDFDIVRTIGEGGNAVVHEARFKGSGLETVAVKQPQMAGGETLDMSAVGEFTAEAEQWSKLDDHENIVGVLDWGSEPVPWIALEYMGGGSLEDRLGTMSTAEALWVGSQVSQAVRHAHRRGVAHLDLKPDNILFAEMRGDTWDIPKVADWGLAKMLLDHSQSVEQLSFHYAAPEQFDSDTFGRAEDLTDIYALGAVVYATLVGEPPFPGATAQVVQGVTAEQPDDPSEHVRGLPRGTDAVVQKALAKEKDDRYESVLDFRRDLDTLLERELGNGDEGSLIAEGSLPSSSAAGAESTLRQPSSRPPEVTAEQHDHERSNTGTGGRRVEGRSPSEPAQSTSKNETRQRKDVPAEAAELDLEDHHHYAVAGIVPIFVGGAAGDAFGGFLVLLGIGISFYYWNKDMKSIKNEPLIDWNPRRWLYFGSSFFVYFAGPVYYFYKRWKKVKEAPVNPD